MTELTVNIIDSIGFIATSTLCSLGAVLGTSCIIIRNVVHKLMSKLAVSISNSFCYVTTSTLRGLGAVFGTSCVIVRCVCNKVMTKLTTFGCSTSSACLGCCTCCIIP